jgi:hypothetical protein
MMQSVTYKTQRTRQKPTTRKRKKNEEQGRERERKARRPHDRYIFEGTKSGDRKKEKERDGQRFWGLYLGVGSALGEMDVADVKDSGQHGEHRCLGFTV